jgi:glutathione S-transferase
MTDFKLYGSPGSLYTGKARSYLIKQGIAFTNHAVGEPRFRAEIVPAVNRWIMPVMETPQGEFVQDGSDIIAWFEAKGQARYPAYPQTPRHKVISQIFELFGGEGLLRPAMHYRWNFDETNRAFLANDFSAALAPTGAGPEEWEQVFAMASARMRKAMRNFAVTADTIPLVEASYEQFLDLLDAHLAHSPYLLGGRPTLGDYGLIAPLYAHLGRDPYPLAMMKTRAYRVWRWVERMNSTDHDAGEYGGASGELFADDSVPDTLIALLKFIAEDYLPEIRASVGFTRQWLDSKPDLVVGTNGLERKSERMVGQVEFEWRGKLVQVVVMPYRLYLLQKVQDAAQSLTGSGRADVDSLLSETGLSEMLTLKTQRRVYRDNHLEVWGELV